MANLNLDGFDANQVEPTTNFDPIPAGKYLAVITESKMKPTKSGNGAYLELTFQIIEGEHKNRLLWARLNLDNPSTIAVQIAKAELSAICRAVNVPTPNDSVELHNLPLMVHVQCERRQDTGEVTNKIKAYSKRESAAATTNAQPQTNGMPPWRRS